MKSNRIRNVLSVLCNLTAIGLTAWSVISFFIADRTGDGNMAMSGFRCFRFYTIDSNILASLCGMFILIFTVRGMFRDRVMIPVWASLLKYIGATSVAVTMITVFVFLGPMLGYPAMLAGNNLFLHLINPLLFILSFLLLETGDELPGYTAWVGLLPVALYGCVYLIMVVSIGLENGGWEDFYGFDRGGLWYVTVIVIAASTYLVCLLLHGIRNMICSRTVEKIYNIK